MTDTVTSLKAKRAIADKEFMAMKPLLDEVYDYVIPYRRPIGGTRGSSQGEQRVNRIFDQTAVKAAMRFPGRLQQDLCPPEETWIGLELGPVGKTLPGADKLSRQLESISEICMSGVQTGEWDTAFPEMCADLLGSTGFMLMLEGDDDRWVRFVTVPMDEMRILPGPYNDIVGYFWDRKWTADNIMAAWPDGKYTDEFRKLVKDKPHDEIVVHQDTVWDRAQKRWCLYVWLEGYEQVIVHREKFHTCPWLSPRYFKLPGETWGRGLAMIAAPSIKTLNKAVELTLKAAAITLLGIYTYTPHSQFNPDTARIEPGQFWPVASNGGVLGPGIQKLQEPRLDLSTIVLNELRAGVEATLLDQALPVDGAAVKSATEIVERVKQLASDFSGSYGRLVMEIVVPLARRLIEIAHRKKMIPVRISIDQLLTKVRVTSPMAEARRVKSVEKTIQFLALTAQLAPQEVMLILDKEELLVDLAQAFGVKQKYIRDADNRKKIKSQVEALIAQALAAAQQQNQPQVEPTAPVAPAAA